MICGFQSALFGVFAKVYATSHGLLPEDRRLDRLERALPLERLLVLAAVVMLVGLLLLGVALNRWRLADFGELDYASTMRVVIPGVTLVALGFQAILGGFLVSVLRTPAR